MEAELRAEYPGILNWAIVGLHRWIHHGLSTPKSSREALQTYRENQDWMRAFLEEWCDQGEGAEVKAQDIYDAYRLWAKGTGEEIKKMTMFGRSIAERGFIKYRKGSGYHYRGLKLTTQAEMEIGKARREMPGFSGPSGRV